MKGQLTIVTTFKYDYKFFWSDRYGEELREEGMEGMDLISDLNNLLKGFNDHLMLRHYYQCICSDNDESRGDKRQILRGLTRHRSRPTKREQTHC